MQEILEGLNMCREASIKQADEIEAELNELSKKNCNLKEELNGIIASKVKTWESIIFVVRTKCQFIVFLIGIVLVTVQ